MKKLKYHKPKIKIVKLSLSLFSSSLFSSAEEQLFLSCSCSSPAKMDCCSGTCYTSEPTSGTGEYCG